MAPSSSKASVNKPHSLKKNLLLALKSSHLKLTHTRKDILQLMSGPHHPWTVEELFQELSKKKQANYDWSTIYRCLKKFVTAEIVTTFDLGDGQLRYELRDEADHHHHHIICRGCQSITAIETCVIAKLEKSIEKKGFTDLSHRLDFFGLCKECQKTENSGQKKAKAFN